MNPLKTNNVFRLALLRWASDDWVSGLLRRAGMSRAAMLTTKPDMRVSELGSRMLHLAAMSPERPSKAITKGVMEFLLAERQANPNAADDYGRTPLTLFITSGINAWLRDEQYGCEVLSLMFEHGADANVYFTPDFVEMAGCGKWTLAHHLADEFHGRGASAMPVAMRRILESRMDRRLPDSAGRSAERMQAILDL